VTDTAYRPAYWRVVVFLAAAVGLLVGMVVTAVAIERNRQLHRWDAFELAPGETRGAEAAP
jgi:NADH:ubiquinone oxidoreductase subunit 3 (subunit A)